MKILLTTPIYSLADEWAEFVGVAETRSLYSLACLSTYLKPHGHDVTILESNSMPLEEFRDRVRNGGFELVGIPSWTLALSKSLQTARMIKNMVPDIKVVIGGVHATLCPEDILTCCPEVDYVIVGEGEKPMLALADTLSNPGSPVSEVPSLYYRDPGGSILSTPRCEYLKPEEIPTPDYENAGIEHFKCYIPHLKTQPTYQLLINRGCPYLCGFCNAYEVHGKRIRKKPLDTIMRELLYLKEKHGARGFYFQDSTFTNDYKWTLSFCRQYKEQINLPWSCYTRVDRINDTILKAMRNSGCWQIGFGFESANDKTLKSIGKKTFAAQNVEAVRLCRKYGINCLVSFILGWPGETYEEALLTVRWAQKHHPNLCIFYIPLPFPNTALWRQAVENNWMSNGGDPLVIENTGILCTNPLYVNPLIGPKRMASLAAKAYLMYYSSPVSIYYALRTIRTWTQLKAMMTLSLSYFRILMSYFRMKL